MQHDSLAFGAELGGELSVEEKLSGELYRARRIRDGRELIVRVVHPQTPGQTADLLARAAAVSSIRHPALAQVEAYGQLAGGACYIASELVRGPSLFEWTEAFGIPSLPQIVELVQNLCSALQTALPLVHEALHPGNVRVLRSRAGLSFKLIDLALPSALIDAAPNPQALLFRAPEQRSALHPRCDAASNVYAVGGILYFLALGEPAYAGNDVESLLDAQAKGRFKAPSSVQLRFPADLNALIVRALALDPEQRFASVAELGEALAACSGSVSQYVQSFGPQTATPSLASPTRVSDPGVAAIGLLSSSPPEHTLDRDTDISALREQPELAASSGTVKRSTERWLALPAIGAACLSIILVARSLLTPDAASDDPAKQGALASRPTPKSEPSAPGLPLTAKVQIREVQVQGGSLPTALIKRAVIRLRSDFKHCYEQSARAAGHNSFDELTVDVQIDAKGRAHSPSVRGGKLPRLETCVAEGASKLISEGPPDTDKLAASWKLAFTP
jgi:serine/threonine protein kinase